MPKRRCQIVLALIPDGQFICQMCGRFDLRFFECWKVFAENSSMRMPLVLWQTVTERGLPFLTQKQSSSDSGSTDSWWGRWMTHLWFWLFDRLLSYSASWHSLVNLLTFFWHSSSSPQSILHQNFVFSIFDWGMLHRQTQMRFLNFKFWIRIDFKFSSIRPFYDDRGPVRDIEIC